MITAKELLYALGAFAMLVAVAAVAVVIVGVLIALAVNVIMWGVGA